MNGAAERSTPGTTVRPLETGDLDDVLGLQRATFSGIAARPAAEVARKLRALYLEGPFGVHRLSHVAVTREDRVVGFRGLLVRRWRLAGEPVWAATGTGVAIAQDERRRGIGRSMVEAARLRARAQGLRTAFALSDRYTAAGLGFGTFLGDVPLDAYGLHWELPVVPRGLAALKGRDRRLDPVEPSLDAAPLDAASLQEVLGSLGAERILHPDPTPEETAWLLAYLEDYPSRGRFVGRVLSCRGERVGLLAGYQRRARLELVAFGAVAGFEAAVCREAIVQVRALGARWLAGRASAWQLPPLIALQARVKPDVPLGISLGSEPTHPEVGRLFGAGDALVTGLEGEAWI